VKRSAHEIDWRDAKIEKLTFATQPATRIDDLLPHRWRSSA
jgi:hypothetical protein